MKRKIAAVTVLAVLLSALVCYGACNEDKGGQASWSAIIHEENSLRASLLYLPYMFLKLPVAIVYGIIYPVPATQAPIPPPAHRAHP